IESLLLIDGAGLLARRDPAHARTAIVSVACDLRRAGWILHSWFAVVTAAEVLLQLGESENAARLFGAIHASPWTHLMGRRLNALESALTASLDAFTLGQVVAQGATLSFDAAVDVARGVNGG